MSIPVVEIVTILKLIKEGVEWAQEQKKLGNITQEQFDAIFDRIELKKQKWDDLGPDDNQ